MAALDYWPQKEDIDGEKSVVVVYKGCATNKEMYVAKVEEPVSRGEGNNFLGVLDNQILRSITKNVHG